MPTVGTFHSFYWTSSDTVVTPIAITTRGYPLWQSTTIAPVGLGIISAWWDTAKIQLLWWWARVQQIRALSRRGKDVLVLVLDALLATPEPYLRVTVGADLADDAKARAKASADYAADAEAVLASVATALQHPNYGAAHQAVRRTAVTLGFNQPQAWVKLSRELKAKHGWAENTWRHLNACHLTDAMAKAQGSTMTNSERHLLVQLAYAGFAKRGR